MITGPESITADCEQSEGSLLWTRSGVFLAVVFLFAGLNAGSFFVRNTAPWRRLTGETRGLLLGKDVQFGFPLRFDFYPGLGILTAEQWLPFAGNVCCAVIVSAVYARMFGKPMQQHSEVEPVAVQPSRWQWQFRFRLIHMLAITTVTAVMLGLFSHAPDPALRALKFVYLAGPCAVLWMFYALRRWSRIRAFAILTSCLLFASVVAKGAALVFNDFTYGLFGMFVCWFPQLLAILVLLFVSRNIQTVRRIIEQSNE